jgi:DNA-binding response OmpR family regulator
MLKNILIVDDDTNFAAKIVNNTINNHFSFCIADSLNRAKLLLKNNDFDIIIANVKVPGGNSIELKKEVQAEKTKFLFFSNIESDYSYIKDKGENCCYKHTLNQSRGNIFENL